MTVKRERLAHPLSIIGFGLMMAAVLIATVPSERWLRQIEHGPTTTLTTAYLKASLHNRGDDLALMNALANNYIESGQLKEAEPLIIRLSDSSDPVVVRRTLLLKMRFLRQQIFSMQPANPQRENLIRDAGQILAQIQTYSWDLTTLESLARESRAFNLSSLSAQFYKQLAQQDPAHATDWHRLAQELELGQGNYREAALAAFAAQALATSLEDQRRYFLAGLKALQAGNLFQVAMLEAQERMGPYLQNDPATLRFVIQLARAANRPDLANRYARRLMEVIQTGALSSREAWLYASNFWDADADWIEVGFDRSAHQPAGLVQVAASSSEPDSPKPATTQEQDDLELIFNSMLENHNLEQALQVAQKANQRWPDDPVWIKRLATVNEWSGRSRPALQSWLALARTTNDQEAWQAVLRLSAGVHDDVTYLEALRHQSADAANELVLVDQIVAAYERLGQVDNALAFLATQMTRSHHRKEVLERYAALAERSGNDDLALQTYQRLNREFGPQTAYALKVANIYNARVNFNAACDVLMSARNKAAPQDSGYWLVLKQTALRAGREDVAKDAAQHLIAANKANPGDIQDALMLWRNSPIDAGRLAESAFRQSGDIGLLQQAVSFYSRAKAWSRIQNLLASLTEKQEEAANRSVGFLLVKAEFMQQTGHKEDAMKILRVALKSDEQSSDVRAVFLWLLIDIGSRDELAAALRHWRSDAEKEEVLWGPYAIGYLILADQANSLHFFQKQERNKLSDPLWALAYADALEAFGKADQAWGIRHQVWKQIAKQRELLNGQITIDATVDSDQQNLMELRQRAIALSDMFAGAEMSRYLLLQVLRQNTFGMKLASQMGGDVVKVDAKDNASLINDAVMQEVALTWALSTESYDLASAWLAQRYAQQLKRPVYADIVLAQANNDMTALDEILSNQADRVPLLNRSEANLKLERLSEARNLQFGGMQTDPDNDGLQQYLRDSSLRIANYVEPWLVKLRLSPLSYVESGVFWKQQLSDQLSLNLRAAQRNQSSDDATVLVNVPRHDRAFKAGLNWKSNDNEFLAEAGNRHAVENFTTFMLKAKWNQQNRLQWSGALGYNQESTESTILRIGGVKDTVTLGMNWNFSVRNFIQARAEAAQYYSQDRQKIGTGRIVELNAGHRFRISYPDFTLRTVVVRADYENSGNDLGSLFGRLAPSGVAALSSVFPASYTQTGLVFGFGNDVRENYTRAWRPFMETAVLRALGVWDHSIRVGVAGSVWGNDRVGVYYLRGRSPATGESGVSEWGVHYRWNY